MIRRVLVAVDDSPASLAAARAAVELAAGWQASLRVVSVVGDHALAERLAAVVAPADGEPLDRRRARAASAMLHHVEQLAERSGVPVETRLREGAPAAVILDEARRWPADLVVLGRSGRHAAGEPAIGSQTRQVLEFAEEPVLVVPRGRA
jgi:nucleotide-binding universal stress UspA family protein